MVIGGEYLRKFAMYTTQQSFSHPQEDKTNQEHPLITHGIHEYYRHPSYVDWFWWACGTQVLLANPVCLTLYVIVSDAVDWILFLKHRFVLVHVDVRL